MNNMRLKRIKIIEAKTRNIKNYITQMDAYGLKNSVYFDFLIEQLLDLSNMILLEIKQIEANGKQLGEYSKIGEEILVTTLKILESYEPKYHRQHLVGESGKAGLILANILQIGTIWYYIISINWIRKQGNIKD